MILLLSSLTASCGDSLGLELVVGRYGLDRIDGAPLPFEGEVEIDGLRAGGVITAGSLVLEADQTWTRSLRITLTSPNGVSEVVEEASGTYSLQNESAIRFRHGNLDETFVGTRDRGRIFIVIENLLFEFGRRA